MRDTNHLRRCAVVFLVYIISIRDASPAAIKSQSASSNGLYDASDNVAILNVTNLKSSIYNSKRAWLVEFYNSWCGHCQRFAPSWKSLAKDIRDWKEVVTIAAVDCADEENTQSCRDQEVMLYPTIKFFGIDSKPSFLGFSISADQNVNLLRSNLVKQLQKEQQEGHGQTWPNLISHRSSDLTNFWKAAPKSAKHHFLFFEKADSLLGAEIILDFQNFKNIHIRRVSSDNEPLCVLLKVKKFPSLLLMKLDGSQSLIKLRAPTREHVNTKIKEIANETVAKQDDSKTKDAVTVVEQLDSKDILYQLDLEKTLQYSLTQEIALSKSIEGEKLIALKDYLDVLINYFPLGNKGSLFLDVINHVIEEKDALTGEEFSRIVQSAETEFTPVYSGTLNWIGCKGSAIKYRGYPCGLWTMFHMLSVSLANEKYEKEDFMKVLRAMYVYVKYFFSCQECSKHFLGMASKNKIFEVRNKDETVLWLWKAHNEVNARLAGDLTEDPMHEKTQYPKEKHCPFCRHKNGEWNEKEVLIYLKKKYSYAKIDYQDASKERVHNMIESEKLKMNPKREYLVSESFEAKRKFGWDFTVFDISICVVLYVISAIILTLVCIKFAVKKTFRKKAFLQKLLLRI